MRRLVLVFLMCLLPLQWGWAAAASVCAHERDLAHFGHHEHQHPGAAAMAQDALDDAADATGDEPPLTFHADCHSCHGIGAAVVPTAPAAGHAPPGDEPVPPDGRRLPEPPVQALLRPPLPLVA